jgi:hypothetical protein
VNRRIANAPLLATLMAFAACSAASSTALAEPPPEVTDPASAPGSHVELPPRAPQPPPRTVVSPAAAPGPAFSPSTRFVAVLAGGLAVVAVGAGATFGAMALHYKNSFDQHPTHDAANFGNEYAYLCDASLGAALILGVTSTLLLLRRDEPGTGTNNSAPPTTTTQKRGTVTLTASPIVTPHGAGAGAVLSF